MEENKIRKNNILRYFSKKNDDNSLERVPCRVKCFLLFGFCFLLYMPNFKVPSVISLLLSYGLPILCILINFNLIKCFSFRQLLLLLLVAILLLISYLLPSIYETQDFSYFTILLNSCKMTLSYVALLCLVIRVYGKQKSLYYFMYYYILTHLVYVAVTLMMVFIPNLRDVWFSIVEKDSMVTASGAYMFRVGWQGFAGFRLTLHCTFSIIFSLFLRYGAKLSVITNRQFIVFIVGCLLGNMFYGRSGLMVSIIVCLVAFLYWNRKKPRRIAILAISVGFVLAGIGLLKYIPGLDSWYNWMSSPIVNLITTGDMDDKSFDTLQKMQQVEISEETFSHGDGYYMDGGHYYMSTDAGFVRNVLFWGIFGAIISYGATFYSIFGFAKISKLLALQFLITFLAFEYKGAVYYEFLSMAFVVETALVAERYDNFLLHSEKKNKHILEKNV